MEENEKIDGRFAFKCTFCKKPIVRPITRKELGLEPGEDPVMGKLYRYAKCYCGFGRFVQCERTSMSADEIEDQISRNMAH